MRLDEVRNLARHRMQFQHYHRSTPTPEFRVPNKKVGTSPLVAYKGTSAAPIRQGRYH
jgi:hypothetical protein